MPAGTKKARPRRSKMLGKSLAALRYRPGLKAVMTSRTARIRASYSLFLFRG